MRQPTGRARAARAITWLWEKCTRSWGAIQVERHGKYSIERLQQLQTYRSSITRARSALILLLTPLPCLAAVVLLDVIPLKPPDTGLAHSHLFWLRAFLMTWFFDIAAMAQLCQIVPRLPITTIKLVSISALVSAGGVSIAFAMAVVIGYPLPFTIVFGTPGTCTVFAISFSVLWGKFLRQNPDVLREFVQCGALTLKLASLTAIYAVYGYVFNSITSPAKPAFTLVLPVLKLVLKNWLSKSAKQIEDFKPEIVIFNVEIFHALEAERRILNSLSPTQRRERIESALQLFYMTECLVLIEYTEVMIPMVYCLYLLVVSHLPNRFFYAQLKDLDSATLESNVTTISLYAFLELASFLVLGWLVGKRHTGVPSIHLLAFVLENQWQMVQAKLVLWVVFAVQSSLEHFGADYSFQFRWLRSQELTQ